MVVYQQVDRQLKKKGLKKEKLLNSPLGFNQLNIYR